MIRIFIFFLSIFTVNWCQAIQYFDSYIKATPPRANKIAKEYFGMHFHRLVLSSGDKKHQTKWPEKIVGAIRLWDSGTRWADITPSAGQWKYERLDAYVDKAITHNVPILYVLGSTPRWASARIDEPCPYGMGCSAEPVRIAHWEEYVRRIAQRYRGKISAYELWNEPFFSELKKQKGESDFFYGPVSKMVEMARVARNVLDETDPKAILTTPGFTGNPNQLELFLSSGGKQHIQAIAFHFYSTNTDEFSKQLLEVRAVMKRQGVADLPLWNTETGLEVYPAEKPLPAGAQNWSRTEAASRMAQFLVLGAAAGLERYYYYAWDNERSGMFSPEERRQPAWDAYEKLHRWLLDAVVLGCESISPNGVLCNGERDGQRFLIVWATKEGIHTIPIAVNQRAISVEKLLSNSANPVSAHDNSLKLMLGSEPLKILLGSKP